MTAGVLTHAPLLACERLTAPLDPIDFIEVRAEISPPNPHRLSLRIDVVDDLTLLEDVWRVLETEGFTTPYQHYAWVEAYVNSHQQHEHIVFVSAQDNQGKVHILLPLVITQSFGMRIASLPGGRQANFQMPVCSREVFEGFSAVDWQDFLHDVAHVLQGVDVFAFIHQPRQWQGVANTLASLASSDSPSNAYGLTPSVDPEEYQKRVLSKDSRKKLRQKERYLSEMGDVSLVLAQNEADVSRILRAFFEQKSLRMDMQGITNTFTDASTRNFFSYLCREGLLENRQSVLLFALCVDGKVVATHGLARCGGHVSGMFNSFALEPEFARCSPGDLLFSRVITWLGENGFHTYDLGVGEARYKTIFCETTFALSDGMIAITRQGSLYARLKARLLFLKRRIKQSPRLWATVLVLRRIKSVFRS